MGPGEIPNHSFTRISAERARQVMEHARHSLKDALLQAQRRFGDRPQELKGLSAEVIAANAHGYTEAFMALHMRVFDGFSERHLHIGQGGVVPDSSTALDVVSQTTYLVYRLEGNSLRRAADGVSKASGAADVVELHRVATRGTIQALGLMEAAARAHEELPTARIAAFRMGSNYLRHLQAMKAEESLMSIRRSIEQALGDGHA